ncbi:MAG: peptidoglycan DD-metalloendopeptidase family protein, partial [Candidatus Nomurabacteria bacterium]
MKKYIFCILFIGLAIFSFFSYTKAQTLDELKSQISNANSAIDKINEEIKALSGKIAVTAEQRNTLSNAIKDLTLKKNKLVKERELTEKKISATGLIIKTLDSEIDNKNALLDKSKNGLASLVKKQYQLGNESFIVKFLSKNNLAEASREYNNILNLNNEIKDNIKDVSSQKDDLTLSKNKKEDEKDVLNKLKKSLTAKEVEITANKKEKNDLLVETKNKESNYKMLLEEQQKRKIAFEKSIEDYESQIQFILNPKSIPSAGTSALSWPLAKILITSPYGSRWGKFHYGVDLRSTVGTSVKAMGTGTVMGTGDTDIACKGASFGKWVFIKYNNGLSSTYGHLSYISATVGQKVNAGDEVALSGNTGSSTGP